MMTLTFVQYCVVLCIPGQVEAHQCRALAIFRCPRVGLCAGAGLWGMCG